MNNHHNYSVDDTNYSTRQQLSDNNVNVNIIQSPILDYYGQESYPSRHIPLYNNHIYQDNPNHFYRYNVLSSNQASVYTCQNGLLGNYSEDNGLSQTDMVHSMSLDLYGLSVSPPSTEVPSDLTSTAETIPSSLNKQEQNSPVIYPWMRKVHINNPG
jgi:hypothetical protein